MKKVIVAAIVGMVAFAQAASVSWKTVAMFDASSAGTKVGGNATAYLYMVNASDFETLDVWATYKDDVLNNSGAGAVGGKGKKTSLSKTTIASPDGTAEATTTYYAAMIVTIGTGDDMQYYAEKKSVLTGEDGNGAATFGLGILDSAANAAGAWKPAVDVPEPTSGLLLLVGGALLALRRKQK